MVNSILPICLSKVVVRKRGKIILNGVSAQIKPDGITIIMGPNGAGKTTILRAMHGLERIKSGSVKWQIDENQTREKQAFVFQTPVIMRRSVLDNIAYPLRVLGETKKRARERAVPWAKEVGLGELLDLNALFLSGGEKQKLAITRALINKPEVLFLDEPTTNLDGQSTKEIEAILLAAQKNGTKIIMATHDLGQAKRLAFDVLFINKGDIYEHSLAKEFFRAPKTKQAKAYLQGDIVE